MSDPQIWHPVHRKKKTLASIISDQTAHLPILDLVLAHSLIRDFAVLKS